jgi:glycosyltransferase involved in cell wall biosynthesis
LKILYYMEPRSTMGGVSNVAYQLVKALAKKVDVIYFPAFKLKKGYITDLLNIYKRFIRGEFDVLHFNIVPTWINGGYILLKFARERNSSSVLNIHGIIPLEHKLEPELGPIPYRALSYKLRVCKLVDKVIVNSRYMYNAVIEWYDIDSRKIVVIPHGVDFKRFSECKIKLALDGDPIVLYVGKLSKIKGVDVLFQAIAKLRLELPRIKLHLVGFGYLNYFQLLAKKLGIEKLVVFHGCVDNLILPAYYKSADFCVLPSKHESFGIVFLEAMASGIPVIATPVGVAPEIICHGENGILVKPNNPDMLAGAVLWLSYDRHLRMKLSQNALKTAAKYSWDNIADQYIALYEDIIRRR